MKKIKKIGYLFTLLISSIFLIKNVFAVNKVYWSELLGSNQYCPTTGSCITYSNGISLGELLTIKGLSYAQLNSTIKIVFNDVLSTNNRITGITNEVDISRNNDGSVMAGIKDNVLYIQYEGTLVFNPISKGLFSKRINFAEQIEGLQYVDTSEVTDMSSMFAQMRNLTSLDLSSFNTTNVTNMSNMFAQTYSMESLNLSSFNTSKVTDMSSMFYDANGLTSLDLSHFNTTNVTNMSYMFSGAFQLTSLNISNFTTTKVTDMSSMFSYVSSLSSLNVSSFNTSNVTDMSYMFNEMRALTSLSVSNFTTTKVTNMSSMFNGLEKITSLNLSSFNTSKVTDMTYMFSNMKNLTSLNISSFNTSNVTSMYGMFLGLSKLTSLSVSNFNTSKVTDMSYMFTGDALITTLNLSNFDTSNVTTMESMFKGMSSLSDLNISSFVTPNVYSMSNMFSGTSSLSSLSVSHFNTSKVTDMSSMFSGSGITSLTLNTFDTSKVIYMREMFSNMANLTTIDISGFNLSAVNNVTNMFYNNSSITTVNMSNSNLKNKIKDILTNIKTVKSLNLNNIIISDTTDMSNLFSDMTNLTTLNIQNFNTSGVTNMESMFENVGKLTSLNLSSFNTADVTNMKNMFKGMSKITSLNLSSFNTSNVTSMEGIFSGMSKLTNLNISSFNTSKVTTFKEMFKNLSLITSLDLSHFNTSSATNTEYMFSGDTNLTSINLTSFNTSNVTSMEGMFKDLVNIVSIDLSSFNSSKNTNFNYMFENCPKLVTIYASSNFKYNDIGSGYHMFYGDVSIIGGLGTTYNDSYYDYAMAKVDTLDIPGYFTFKGNITSTTYDIDNENKTITVSGGTIDPTKIETGGLTIDYTPGGDTVEVYYDNELVSTYNVIYELTVIWKNYDGTILETDEKVVKNTMPTYNGETPSRENTAEYTYEYIGWDKEIAPVTDDITYTAVYRETKNKYLITFVNYDDEVISQKEYEYGTLAANIVKPANPTRPSTVDHVYTFNSWTPSIANVTAAATYKATYTESTRKYTITFVNDDDSVISQKEYDYNTPAANITIPANPTKESTAEYTYTFNKWDKTITKVTKDATYKAEYTATKNKYLITFKNEDDSVISSIEYEYGTPASNIVKPVDPTKANTAEYTYTFNGWTPTITDVTGTATYKATFNSTKNKYLITFVDYNDEVISETEYEYGTLAANIVKPSNPTRPNNMEHGYEFAGWTPTIANVTGAATYKATYNEIIAKYTVTFVNDDDSVISQKEYEYNTPVDSIVKPANPTKKNTAEYTYTFTGWTPTITNVTENITYKATFSSTKNKYKITFKTENDVIISEAEYEYGTPASSIVKPADQTKENTAEYTYTFSGWSPIITDVTEAATYKATFSSTKNKYKITFVNYNDEVLSEAEYEYGTLASDIVAPSNPTKPSNNQHAYVFTGWNPEVANVTGAATYKATYDETEAKYTITFVNSDNSIISQTEYVYGTPASSIVKPADPTKPKTAEYTYTFAGWTPTIEDVTKDATYKATFTSTKNKYKITFIGGNNEILSEREYEYGTPASSIIKPSNPTKTETAEYTYTFTGWSPTIKTVTNNATYTATFSSTKKKYTITFVNYNNDVISSKQYEYGTPASSITKPSNPTRPRTAEYTYTFASWTPNITNVTQNATYKAEYTATKNKYTIAFVNENNILISYGEYEYGTPASQIAIPAEPTKESTSEYIYTFSGWYPHEVTTVTENVTYKATFTSTPRVAIQSITTNKSEINLHTNDVYRIIATINPSNVTEDKTLTWRSTKPSVATVDENGRVTALSEGATVIIIQSSNNKYALVQIVVDNEKESEVNYIPGDLDNDGKITLTDVIMILKIYLGITNTTNSAADLNGNGNIELDDVITLIRMYLGVN